MPQSLVIPTLNGGPRLHTLLAALAAQEGAADLEKVAIDSGSTDGTVEALSAAGFRVLRTDRARFDHGSTRDEAIAATSGDVILLLTQDAVPVGTDWLVNLRAHFADPTVAGAWCRQVAIPGCHPIMARRIAGWCPEQGRRQQLPPGKGMDDLAPMDRLMLCAFDNVASSVRRSVWERFKFGPRPFGEDIAFGFNVIAAGLAIVYAADAVVEHSHDRSAWVEGKRTFCDHRNLRARFGLQCIPDKKALKAAIRDGTRAHLAFFDSQEVAAADRARLRRWTEEYVRWQCWGQYLGARAADALAKPTLGNLWLRMLANKIGNGA